MTIEITIKRNANENLQYSNQIVKLRCAAKVKGLNLEWRAGETLTDNQVDELFLNPQYDITVISGQ